MRMDKSAQSGESKPTCELAGNVRRPRAGCPLFLVEVMRGTCS